VSVLRVVQISRSFSGLQALSGVSLEVSGMEILGLIGSNGSGKTTLVNVITGVLPPDSGRVYVGDVDATNMGPDQIARLGVGRTFQVARLFGSLTVVENVELGVMMAARRGIDSQVKWMLDRLGLTDWASARASTLPYGVKRRLEIARALGTRPRILLMDEPAAGLNDDESDELLDTIHKIRKDSEFACSMLIIDHDPRLIIRLCDRIHVLDQGRTIAEGTPKEIQQNTAVIESYLGKRYDTGEVSNPAPAGLEKGA